MQTQEIKGVSKELDELVNFIRLIVKQKFLIGQEKSMRLGCWTSFTNFLGPITTF